MILVSTLTFVFWAVAESVPVQNQAAAQKLLQKMNHPNQGDRQFKGRKHRGKGKQEEPQVFTLDEWEKRNNGAKPPTRNELPDTSYDERLAWQLQNQLDVEDSHVSILEFFIVTAAAVVVVLISLISFLFRCKVESRTQWQMILK